MIQLTSTNKTYWPKFLNQSFHIQKSYLINHNNISLECRIAFFMEIRRSGEHMHVCGCVCLFYHPMFSFPLLFFVLPQFILLVVSSVFVHSLNVPQLLLWTPMHTDGAFTTVSGTIKSVITRTQPKASWPGPSIILYWLYICVIRLQYVQKCETCV